MGASGDGHPRGFHFIRIFFPPPPSFPTSAASASVRASPSLSSSPSSSLPALFSRLSVARTFSSASEGAVSSDAAAPVAAASAGAPFRRLPWLPSSSLDKHSHYRRRMKGLVDALEQERLSESLAARPAVRMPRPGQLVEVKTSVPENRRRAATFRGIVIATSNRASRSTFTVRNHFGPGGVERTFPLLSPHVEEIKVLGEKKVRRAKLYYLRNRLPKEYRVQ